MKVWKHIKEAFKQLSSIWKGLTLAISVGALGYSLGSTLQKLDLTRKFGDEIQSRNEKIIELKCSYTDLQRTSSTRIIQLTGENERLKIKIQKYESK
jgi:hypothetical protein